MIGAFDRTLKLRVGIVCTDEGGGVGVASRGASLAELDGFVDGASGGSGADSAKESGSNGERMRGGGAVVLGSSGGVERSAKNERGSEGSAAEYDAAVWGGDAPAGEGAEEAAVYDSWRGASMADARKLTFLRDPSA